MRPTLLGFRSPDERTAEFASEVLINREGKKLNVVEDNK